MLHTLELETKHRSDVIDISEAVAAAVGSARVREGICVVYSPHTTAGVTVNERADPDVMADVLAFLEHAVTPMKVGFRHREGNADSHVKASLMGPSVSLVVHDGRLALGTWQGIFFCEFDGPRRRQVFVQVQGEAAANPESGEIASARGA